MHQLKNVAFSFHAAYPSTCTAYFIDIHNCTIEASKPSRPTPTSICTLRPMLTNDIWL